MVHWVYILRCKDNCYYVGETERLYTRFWEHMAGLGGVNTAILKPETIVAIYKLDNLSKFFDYNANVIDTLKNNYTKYNSNGYDKWLLLNFDDSEYVSDYSYLETENNITECLMLHHKENWHKIRGGQYTRFCIEYDFPDNYYLNDIPVCKCGLPCDIKKNIDKNYLFFRCAKKNMWDKFKEDFDIEEEPCNFYMEYTTDRGFREQEIKNSENRKTKLKELFKTSRWLKNVPISDYSNEDYCVGDCKKNNDYNRIVWNDEDRKLCINCFIDKNELLKNKYSYTENNVIGKCLIKLKPKT